MLLYDYFRSSAAYRVRIALNLKGLTADRHPIHLRRGEQLAPDYAKLNPQHLLPALATDDGNLLTQSMAILEYLEETHPAPPLLPADPVGRARVRALAYAVACDIHPLQNLRVTKYLSSEFNVPAEEAPQRWSRHWIELGFTAIEAMLDHPATAAFCHGDTPTLADICLVPQVFNAERIACDLTPFPRLMAIADHARAHAAFAAAHPSVQPDAED